MIKSSLLLLMFFFIVDNNLITVFLFIFVWKIVFCIPATVVCADGSVVIQVLLHVINKLKQTEIA